MSRGELLLAALVIVVAAAQITLRSEDPNGTALASVVNVIHNTGGDLNQYRPLSAYLAVGLQALFGLSGPPFQAIRFVQCLLLFGLAYVYYGQLRIEPRWRLVGIGLLTGLVSLQLGTLGPNGFSMDRFFDAIFYLLAGTLVLSNHDRWIPALVAIAIANRETAVFMPTLVLARYPLTSVLHARNTTVVSANASTDAALAQQDSASHRRAIVIAAASWAVAAIVYLAIHTYYGAHPRTEDSYFGPQMFLHSLSMPGQTAFFLAAVNILPLLAVLVLKDADPFLQRLFWMIVPLWFAVHIWAARLGEGLMYLAPLALIGVPLALQGLQRRLAPLADVVPAPGRSAYSEATRAPVAQGAARPAPDGPSPGRTVATPG